MTGNKRLRRVSVARELVPRVNGNQRMNLWQIESNESLQKSLLNQPDAGRVRFYDAKYQKYLKLAYRVGVGTNRGISLKFVILISFTRIKIGFYG